MHPQPMDGGRGRRRARERDRGERPRGQVTRAPRRPPAQGPGPPRLRADRSAPRVGPSRAQGSSARRRGTPRRETGSEVGGGPTAFERRGTSAVVGGGARVQPLHPWGRLARRAAPRGRVRRGAWRGGPQRQRFRRRAAGVTRSPRAGRQARDARSRARPRARSSRAVTRRGGSEVRARGTADAALARHRFPDVSGAGPWAALARGRAVGASAPSAVGSWVSREGPPRDTRDPRRAGAPHEARRNAGRSGRVAPRPASPVPCLAGP